MDPSARFRAIASEMLSTARMPEPDARERARQAADREYWLRLASGLSIDAPPCAPLHALASAVADECERHFAREGYCETPPILGALELARLNGAIDALAVEGWPPVFAWVYDEFWALAQHADVRRLLTSQLGDGYSQIPHIWTHVVPAVSGSTGWMPHFDGLTNGRTSVWVALTDATLANGCMHIVPRRLLPPAFATEPLDTGRVMLADALRALQGVRALPVSSGSLLAWNFDVLHWGGACVTPERARRAISMEFMAAGETPGPGETPLLPIDGTAPPFADRLRLIAIAIEAYRKFEPGLIRYRAVAEQLRA